MCLITSKYYNKTGFIGDERVYAYNISILIYGTDPNKKQSLSLKTSLICLPILTWYAGDNVIRSIKRTETVVLTIKRNTQ